MVDFNRPSFNFLSIDSIQTSANTMLDILYIIDFHLPFIGLA